MHWEIWSAVANVIMAAGTLWLARDTRRSVRNAESDQAAQWRPLITPSIGIRLNDGALEMTVVNTGRGPALSMRAQINHAWSAANGSIAAVPAGDEIHLRFDGVEVDGLLLAQIDYEDLAGRVYASNITIGYLTRDGRKSLRVLHVAFHDERQTILGAPIYPQDAVRAFVRGRPAPEPRRRGVLGRPRRRRKGLPS